MESTSLSCKRFFNEIIIVIHERKVHPVSDINDKHKKVKSRIQFQLLTFEGLMFKNHLIIQLKISSKLYTVLKRYLKDKIFRSFIHAEIRKGKNVVVIINIILLLQKI